jgi:hypothetical protein
MSERFDMYSARPDEVFHRGDVMTLDGIDGFYDQYFEAAAPGEAIRFVVLVNGPSAFPASSDETQRMTFVTARVLRSDVIAGDVLVESVSTLGEWMRSVELPVEPVSNLGAQEEISQLTSTIAAARRDGIGFWRSGARYWRRLDETSAILAVSHAERLRVVVLRTNASWSWVAEVDLGVS